VKRKVLLGISASLLVGLGALAYLAAPYLATPRFSVLNATRNPVQVTAYWRNESKLLGTIAPNQEVEFTVNAEAAISFKAKYENGKEVASEGMYFTSGTSIEAKITGTAIELRYEPRTSHLL
jgi:hypothetical protein